MKEFTIPFLFSGVVRFAGCATVDEPNSIDWDSPAPRCELCHPTVQYCHDFSDAPIYTGQWEFVSPDGKVTAGTWRHQKMMCILHRTREGQEFVTQSSRTGLLLSWWDTERKRPYLFQEYLLGEQHGYYSRWYPTRQVQSMGIYEHEHYDTRVMFEPSGKTVEVLFRHDDKHHVGSALNFPREGRRYATLVPREGQPYTSKVPEDKKPHISFWTNVVETTEGQ
jgi:hypothetical protein